MCHYRKNNQIRTFQEHNIKGDEINKLKNSYTYINSVIYGFNYNKYLLIKL